jgi:hypothetical protein
MVFGTDGRQSIFDEASMQTRRDLLKGMALTGASVASAALPFRASAQTARPDITAQIRADLEKHASFGEKFSGGPGDNATADWIAGRLRTSGYRVTESTFDAPYFVKRTARLTSGTVSADVVAQAPVVPTDAHGITAPLAMVENAVGDISGRIALLVLPFARHAALFPDRGIGQTVKQAAAGGARAIVIVTTGPTGEAIALNAPEQPFVPIPTAILAPTHADAFKAAAKAGANATLVLDGDATHRPSKNLVARIERGPRWLVISTPRSGWFGCVGERGTGTAAFLELADWAPRRFPDLSIFVMNTGGHEYFFAGSHRVVDQAPPPDVTLAWTHIGAALAARDATEHDGKLTMLDTADPQRTLMVTAAARGAATEAFRGLSGLEQPADVRPGAGELSAFTDRGYRNAFAVLGIHRSMHTALDTLDSVDARLVVPVLRAHQRTIELLVS